MITFSSNSAQVLGALIQKIREGFQMEKLTRAAAVAVLPEMRKRVHVDGQDSRNTPIGEYSDSYLNERERKNRGRNTKVILSLTRQMENDLHALPGERGWGIGYLNAFNAKKARENEQRYRSKILTDLTLREREIVHTVINEEVKNAISG